jgi:hypothetical protein
MQDVEFHLDRRVLTVTTFARDARDNPTLAHWRSCSPAERVAAVEFLRRQFIEPGTRLRRILRVTDRARRLAR